MAEYERLTPEDSSFLYVESPAAHMHVAGLSIFDGQVDMDEVYEHIEGRLHLVPRFRKKVMWVPLQQGRPVLVDDENFDIRYHVRHTAVASPGTEKELKELTARLVGAPLDRARPLWELWIIDLPDGRQATLTKTHHTLTDGISGVDLATVLLDLTPEPSPIEHDDWTPEPAPSPTELLVDSIQERMTQPAELARSLRAALRTPTEFAQSVASSLGDVWEFTSKGAEPAPKTSLSKKIGPHRRFDFVRSSLDDVKAVKNATGTTVNDVVLAMVSGGMRELLLSRGDIVDGLTLRVLVPMSIRSDDQRQTFGNQVSGMLADLPVGEADPSVRLQKISKNMNALKASGEAVGAEAIMRFADYAPPTLLALAGRLMNGPLTSGVNITVTNVPGPQFPLYFRGNKMIEAFPVVPLISEVSVGIAVLSYDGGLNFGLMGDYDIAPDLHVLAEGIEKGLVDLSK